MKEHLTTLFGLIAQLNYTDAKSIRVALNGRLDILAKAKRGEFAIDDDVYFMHQGKKIMGKVIKIMRKNIKVKTNANTWTVYPSLLMKEDSI